MTPVDLMGGWHLAYCRRYTDARMDDPLGPNPTGLILYTGDGMMSAFLHKDPALTWTGPLLTAYSGTWSLSDGVVRHQVIYNTEAGRAGTTLIRRARFEDDLLVLQTEKRQSQRGLSWMDFAWKRP